ncbi:MAG: response regulator [Candidatus Taylorbacteria bacterium]|nr:response regulator [Candidatus Taylorbacteria bacterium]
MKKILIIDDQVALTLAALLKYFGYTNLVTAFDGEEGIRMFETEKPDLVISDFDMPKLDGMGVLRHIRSKSKTPVIMTSSDTEDGFLEKALRAEGADHFLGKPFDTKQLIELVQKLLRN